MLADGVRATIACVAATSLVATGAAWLLGPLPHVVLLGAAWTAIASAAIASAWSAIDALLALRGVGAARALAPSDGQLASTVRSAWELAVTPPAGSSPALVHAHASSIASRLRATRPVAAVRFDAARLGVNGRAVAALALAIALATTPRARAGVFALVHPLATTRTDAPTAVVVRAIDARVVYPSYLDREPLRIPSATRIDAPMGSTIEIEIMPAVEARRVELSIGEHHLSTSRDGAAFRATFLVAEDAAIGVLVTDATGRAIHDSQRRAIHAVADAAPTVRLLAPEADDTIASNDTILVTYVATDDVGVVDATLVIVPPGGHEIRRVLHGTSSESGLAGDTLVQAADLEAQPGDRVALWVEARDANDVSGPGVGRSVTRTLTLASASTERQDAIADLAAVRDAALIALADRLEVAVPDGVDLARARFADGSSQITAIIAALGRLSVDARRGNARRTDAPVYTGMITRLRRVLGGERRSVDPDVRTLDERTRADGAVRAELEDDVLALTDLLDRARVEDAAEIARELEALRREIASLLRELARAPTDEARAALRAAIDRADQRLSELRARLAAMGTSAPAEFANVTEEDARETQAALDAMRAGLDAGDLDAAMRAMTTLAQQIDGIARALGEGSSAFASEHFGPRDRALADAMDALGGLEAEAHELANASTDVRSSAAHAALDEMGDRGAANARAIAGDARSVADAFGGLAGAHLGPIERDQRAHAQQRWLDVADALASGDLGEASRMAEQGDDEAESLARDLELEAMMFPGHDGSTADAARRARDGARHAHDLRSAIDRAIPDLREHLDAAGRTSLHDGIARDTAARESAGRLADRFDHGPDGEPLAPDVGPDLRAIGDLIGEARTAREHQDPVATADDESEAARRLSALRQRLEEDAQHRRDESDGGGSRDLGQPVEIPEDHEGPMELRRRLLDAMSEDAPTGYGDAVRRYYEGLLR
jgi:hypothetical protein